MKVSGRIVDPSWMFLDAYRQSKGQQPEFWRYVERILQDWQHDIVYYNARADLIQQGSTLPLFELLELAGRVHVVAERLESYFAYPLATQVDLTSKDEVEIIVSEMLACIWYIVMWQPALAREIGDMEHKADLWLFENHVDATQLRLRLL